MAERPSDLDPTIKDAVERLVAEQGPRAVLDLFEHAMAARTSSVVEDLKRARPAPLRRAPKRVRGFRVRLDLVGAKPPVWRRLLIPGDILLPDLDQVIQTAMGWSGYHLHQFATSFGPDGVFFTDDEELREMSEWMRPEVGVRLDQLVADVGDTVGYEYDFGDGWRHRLKVEEVLDAPPSQIRCLAGRRACPPEDSGGIWGYAELAAWVRSGYDDALLPGAFDSADEAHDWLSEDWHPDAFDLDEVNEDLASLLGE